MEIKFRHKKSQIDISCTPEFVASLCSHKISLDPVRRRCPLPEDCLPGGFLASVLFRSCRRQSFSRSGEEEAGELGLVDGAGGLACCGETGEASTCRPRLQMADLPDGSDGVVFTGSSLRLGPWKSPLCRGGVLGHLCSCWPVSWESKELQEVAGQRVREGSHLLPLHRLPLLSVP